MNSQYSLFLRQTHVENYKQKRYMTIKRRVEIATSQLEKNESKTQKRIKSVKRNSCKF